MGSQQLEFTPEEADALDHVQNTEKHSFKSCPPNTRSMCKHEKNYKRAVKRYEDWTGKEFGNVKK